MEYFTCEDVPLLDDCYKDIGDIHHIEIIDVHKDLHGHFEVAEFPETPLLTHAVNDDEFCEFIQSPTSEDPPALKAKAAVEEPAKSTSAEIFTIDYVQHIAIILFVQLLIPIPFMLPMGINFTKRALKIFVISFTVGLAGHSLVDIAQALPSLKPFGSLPFTHLAQHLPVVDDILPIFLTQFKITAMGGFVVGAVMAHVLNFFILGHTACRLVRGLEPDPSAMRRAMDSSKAFQNTQRILLDLITGVCMMPVGLTVRASWLQLLGLTSTPLSISQWHAALAGVTGTAVVQLALRVRGPGTQEIMEEPMVQGTQMAQARRELISF